jgi:CheY-like chemotaxis protein
MATSARLRALVVDDHPATAEATAVILALDGHEVATANSGASGFAKAVTKRPDLVIVHIGLPDIDGYEVARQIQTLPLSPRPFLVAVADSANDTDTHRCAQAGFDLCIPEPISPTVLEVLADLLLVSKGLVARSREIAEQNRTVVTNMMLRHMEIAHTLLDSADVVSIHALRERCIARATAGHDRVFTWLDTGACDDRRPEVVQALGELRARLFP